LSNTGLLTTTPAKSAGKLKSVLKRKKKGLKSKCPKSKNPAIRYEKYSYTIWLDRKYDKRCKKFFINIMVEKEAKETKQIDFCIGVDLGGIAQHQLQAPSLRE